MSNYDKLLELLHVFVGKEIKSDTLNEMGREITFTDGSYIRCDNDCNIDFDCK